MLGWRRNLYVLTSAGFMIMSSFSMVLPFLPQYLREMGVRDHLETWSGMVLGASFLAGAVVSPVWGALGDRYGQKAMVIRSGASIAVVNLLMSFAGTPYHLLALRVMSGLLGGFLPAGNALAASMVPAEEIAYALGLIQISAAAGSVFGPVLGGALADSIGIRLTFVAAFFIVSLATLLVALFVREGQMKGKIENACPSPGGSVFQTLRSMLRHKGTRRILLVILLGQLTAMSVQPVMSLVIEGMAAKSISLLAGMVISAAGLATLIATPFWTRLVRVRQPQTVLWLTLVAAGLTNAWQALATGSIGLGVGRFWFGFFHSGFSQMSNALLAGMVEPGRRGAAFGIASSVWMLGGVAGPTVGGLLAYLCGLRAPFWLNAGILVAAAFWARRSLTDRSPAA